MHRDRHTLRHVIRTVPAARVPLVDVVAAAPRNIWFVGGLNLALVSRAVVVEVEAAVMSDAIQEEVVRAVIVTMIVQMSAIEKQEGNVLVMRITEDRSQFVHVAIKAKIEMIEVNT